jgi:DNA invertase Pin-like site-specific DNA recombinase
MSGGIDPGCIRIRLAIQDERVSAVALARDRPQLARAIEALDQGDVLAVVRIDRLACTRAR